MENLTVDPVVVSWFGWKNNKLPSYYKDKKLTIISPFPILFATINVVFILGLISFFVLSNFKKLNFSFKRMLVLTVVVWITNMMFSVFAAPIELRYQIFPMIIIMVFSTILMIYIVLQTKKNNDVGVVTFPLVEPVI